MEQFIQDVTRGAGAILKEKFTQTKNITEKNGASDVVTDADLAANNYIINAIKEKYPTHGIISEESAADLGDSEYTWIIDPLDGTFNFASDLPLFLVMIALVKNEVVELAALYNPILEELFYAKKGNGAFLNGQKISCSKREELNHASVALGVRFDSTSVGLIQKLVDLGKTNTFFANFYSSSGYASVLAACARRDYYLNPGNPVWDLAAASLLLSESGCTITNIQGAPWTLQDKTMLAANPVLHTKVLQFLNS